MSDYNLESILAFKKAKVAEKEEDNPPSRKLKDSDVAAAPAAAGGSSLSEILGTRSDAIRLHNDCASS